MIVRDEEDVLARCLQSVEGLFDEIIIVDTGSKDLTKETALRFTPLVYDFEWTDDFAAARNFAFSKASGDYLMWLDADDVIEGGNRDALREILQKLDETRPDVVMLPYSVVFDRNGRAVLSYWRERIVRAGAGFWFIGRVHEAIPPKGKIIRGNATVSHRKIHENPPWRNLKIFEKMISEGERLEPRMKYYYARELRTAGRREEALKMYSECASDGSAWVENRISALFESFEIFWEDGQEDEADGALFGALRLGAPRSDICCALGARFLKKGDLNTAKFWYQLAPARFGSGEGFVHADYGGYIPYLQLCVICDREGEYELAERYNELAAAVYPESEAVKANRAYFARIKESKSNK